KRWESMLCEINKDFEQLTDEDSDAVTDALTKVLDGIEEKIIHCVAITPQGLAVQMRVLRHNTGAPVCGNSDPFYGPIFDNIFEGLRRLEALVESAGDDGR